MSEKSVQLILWTRCSLCSWSHVVYRMQCDTQIFFFTLFSELLSRTTLPTLFHTEFQYYFITLKHFSIALYIIHMLTWWYSQSDTIRYHCTKVIILSHYDSSFIGFFSLLILHLSKTSEADTTVLPIVGQLKYTSVYKCMGNRQCAHVTSCFVAFFDTRRITKTKK